jgi:hypothetical protein
MALHSARQDISPEDAPSGGTAPGLRRTRVDVPSADAQIAGHVQAAIQPGFALVRTATVILRSARWSTGLGLIAGGVTWQGLLQIGFVPIAHVAGAVGAMLIGACLGRPLDTFWKRFG